MGNNKVDKEADKVENELEVEEMDESEAPAKSGNGKWNIELVKKDLEKKVNGLKPGKVLVFPLSVAYSRWHGGNIEDGATSSALGGRKWKVCKVIEDTFPGVDASYSGDKVTVKKLSQ